MPPILHNFYDLMCKTLYLVSNREGCEGKRAVTVSWLELCNISTVSLDSKSVFDEHRPHT